MNYFVDYENVNSQGLKGIETLTDKDNVNVYYSAEANTMKMDTVKMLMSSSCKVDLREVETTKFKNFLDFNIVCDVMISLFKDNEDTATIISKDKDYMVCCNKAKAFDKTVKIFGAIGENNAPENVTPKFYIGEEDVKKVVEDIVEKKEPERKLPKAVVKNAKKFNSSTIIVTNSTPKKSKTVVKNAKKYSTDTFVDTPIYEEKSTPIAKPDVAFVIEERESFFDKTDDKVNVKTTAKYKKAKDKVLKCEKAKWTSKEKRLFNNVFLYCDNLPVDKKEFDACQSLSDVKFVCVNKLGATNGIAFFESLEEKYIELLA